MASQRSLTAAFHPLLHLVHNSDDAFAERAFSARRRGARKRPMIHGPNSLCLVKGGHRYLFRYHSGQEPQVISALVELAEDPRWDISWLDAAILSYQMDL